MCAVYDGGWSTMVDGLVGVGAFVRVMWRLARSICKMAAGLILPPLDTPVTSCHRDAATRPMGQYRQEETGKSWVKARSYCARMSSLGVEEHEGSMPAVMARRGSLGFDSGHVVSRGVMWPLRRVC